MELLRETHPCPQNGYISLSFNGRTPGSEPDNRSSNLRGEAGALKHKVYEPCAHIIYAERQGAHPALQARCKVPLDMEDRTRLGWLTWRHRTFPSKPPLTVALQCEGACLCSSHWQSIPLVRERFAVRFRAEARERYRLAILFPG